MTAIDQQGILCTGRDHAILTAVHAGRAELSCSCEPDLFIDGLYFCDQEAAHRLVHTGLIAGATPGSPGSRVPAILTAFGAALLSATTPPIRE